MNIETIKFAIVGASGIVVNTAILYSLHSIVPLQIASILAVQSAIVTNFIFNDTWTFAEYKNRPLLKRFVSFESISIIGMIINVCVLTLLTYFDVYYLLANTIGILVAFIWNLNANKKVTWA